MGSQSPHFASAGIPPPPPPLQEVQKELRESTLMGGTFRRQVEVVYVIGVGFYGIQL